MLGFLMIIFRDSKTSILGIFRQNICLSIVTFNSFALIIIRLINRYHQADSFVRKLIFFQYHLTA